MFIAVGDEGCQWVDMVSVLHHWDFIGLLKKKNKKKTQLRSRLPVCSKCLIYQS